MGWLLILWAMLAVTAFATPLDTPPAANTEVLDKLERAVRIKGLLRQLDSLPDSDLRELLVQLRALRRRRMTPTPPPRDLTKVPIGQLTEDELMQIANLIPAIEKRPKKPYVPLDIPHDLTRIPMSQFIEAFRIVHPETDVKNLEVKLQNKYDSVFGEEERQGGTGQKEDSDKDTNDKDIIAKDQTHTNDTHSKPIIMRTTLAPGLDGLGSDADH